MGRYLVLCLFAILLLSSGCTVRTGEMPSAEPESQGMSGAQLARLDSVLNQYAESQRLAGAVLLVARNGTVIHRASVGFRDIESQSLMTDDTIFRIASQSKAVISVATMILQEEGRLLISDPVSKYLPEYANTTVAQPTADGYEVVPASRQITIRDLLTHTAGIGYGWGPAASEWVEAGISGWYFGHFVEPIRETVRRMASLPMDAQPGTAFVYGYNTDILGALLEVAAGEPLDKIIQGRILDPLDMRDTHFYLPEVKRDRLAAVYSMKDGTLRRAPAISAMEAQGAYVDGPRMSFSGGAGLLSTARDYSRFLQMVLNGGELNGVRLLSPSTVHLMTINHLNTITFPWTPGVGFGLGFSVVMDQGAYGAPGSVGEFGWGGAYHSTYWADPETGLLVVYFTQLTPVGDVDDYGKLRAMIHGAFLE